MVTNSKPSIVIVGGRFPIYLDRTNFDNGEGGVEPGDWGEISLNEGISFSEAFKQTIGKTLESGAHVIFVYPIPEVGFHVPKTIIRHYRKIKSNDGAVKFDTSYKRYIERTKSTFELFDSIESTRIYRVYPSKEFCNQIVNGRCSTHDNNNIWYSDYNHTSFIGSEMIVELIVEQIKNAEANIRGN